MKKKIFTLITAFIMAIMSAGLTVSAEDDIKVTLDGKTLTFDQPPIIQDGRTLVPMRAIFEAIGADVKWDGAAQSVSAKKGNTSIKMTINKNSMSKTNDGKSSTTSLDVPPIIVNDRTLVPARVVAEAFGCDVQWNGDSKTVIIDSMTLAVPSPYSFCNYALRIEEDTYNGKNRLTLTDGVESEEDWFMEDYLNLISEKYNFELVDSGQSEHRDINLDVYSYYFKYTGDGDITEKEYDLSFHVNVSHRRSSHSVIMYYSPELRLVETSDRTTRKLTNAQGSSNSSSGGSSSETTPCVYCSGGRCRTCGGSGYVEKTYYSGGKRGTRTVHCHDCNFGKCTKCGGDGWI